MVVTESVKFATFTVVVTFSVDFCYIEGGCFEYIYGSCYIKNVNFCYIESGCYTLRFKCVTFMVFATFNRLIFVTSVRVVVTFSGDIRFS